MARAYSAEQTGAENDVNAVEEGAEIIPAGEAHLEFLMEFHGLIGEDEFGGRKGVATVFYL